MNTQPDDIIEDALRTYPLPDVPPNFSSKIMEQIRARSMRRVAAPRAPFRLTWMDFALAFFLTLIPLAALVTWATLPRLAVLRLTFQWQLVQASGIFPILIVPLTVVGALLLAAFVFSINLVFRPTLSMR